MPKKARRKKGGGDGEEGGVDLGDVDVVSSAICLRVDLHASCMCRGIPLDMAWHSRLCAQLSGARWRACLKHRHRPDIDVGAIFAADTDVGEMSVIGARLAKEHISGNTGPMAANEGALDTFSTSWIS